MSPEGPPIQPQPPVDDTETTKKDGAQEEFEQEPFSKQFEDLAHQAHELLEQAPNDAVRSIATRIENSLRLTIETARDFETRDPQGKIDRTIASSLIDRLYDSSVTHAAINIWRVPQWDQAEPLKDLVSEIEDARYELAQMLKQKFKIEQIAPFEEVDRFDTTAHEDDLAGPLTTTDPARDNLIVQVLRSGVRANGEVVLRAIVRRALYDKKAAESKDDDVIEVAAPESPEQEQDLNITLDQQLHALLEQLKTELEQPDASPAFRASLLVIQNEADGIKEGLQELRAGAKLEGRLGETALMNFGQLPAIFPTQSREEFQKIVYAVEELNNTRETLRRLLEKEHGVAMIAAIPGDKFDYTLHEDNPVTRLATNKQKDDKTIYEVIRSGFTQNGKVVRKAYVKQRLYHAAKQEASESTVSTEFITDFASSLIRLVDKHLSQEKSPTDELLKQPTKEMSGFLRGELMNIKGHVEQRMQNIIKKLTEGADPEKDSSLQFSLQEFNFSPHFAPGSLNKEEQGRLFLVLDKLSELQRDMREWLQKEYKIGLIFPEPGTKFDPATQEDNEAHRLPAKTKANAGDLYEIIRNGFTHDGKVVEKAYVKRYVLTDTTPEVANKTDDYI